MFFMTTGGALLAQKQPQPAKQDSLRFPLSDRRGDPFSWRNRNPFDLPDSAYLRRNIEYDPKTNRYYIIEKVGDHYYRKPTYLSFDEFWKLKAEMDEEDYFHQRAQTLADLNRKTARPYMRLYDKLFNRIFGNGPEGLKVDIRPQGGVEMRLGYEGQRIDNPTLPERARSSGGFDFNLAANVNVQGNIGDKLRLPISYNTQATFDFENQLKLDYKGSKDEIIKSIEAGNIAFQSKGTLMSSVQSLFGVKAQLQFGRLFITSAIANQRSQRQAVTLAGGGLAQQLNKPLDDYEENKHFLLGQYFRSNYNKAMSNLPVVTSQVQILRMEAWVTNRTGITTDTRNIVGLMDLGENNPYNPNVHGSPGSFNTLPQNTANDLYQFLTGSASNRDPRLINSLLIAHGLSPVNDFEKTFARKLKPEEYDFNPQVGFISLLQQLQPDEVLGVAYQYTYNGHVYQVGEFSQDVTVDSTQGVQKVMFLKLLKATSQRVQLPLWQLMMKNVYSLDITGLQQQDFNLNIYYNEPSGGAKRYLPESSKSVDGRTLLSILRLDRLNSHNDPSPDGVYDFVDGYTVQAKRGRIIFPVLEPFGRDLDTLAFAGSPPELKKKYVFYQLYDSIKAIAQTYANVDRFVAKGTAKGVNNQEISLGGINIPPGSVTVTAGGQVLRENIDYIIDYNAGTMRVINQAILNSGIPVNVQFENNAAFGLQQRSFFGTRLDYAASDKLALGMTYEHLSERPFYTKVNYGEDPISNSMYGIDFNYKSQLPQLTRLLNRLPFYSSNAPSSIHAYGEAALLKPGHPAQIGSGAAGAVYLDDFEATVTDIDLRYPVTSWVLASTPQNDGLFPEGSLTDSIDYGKNRAKLAWYYIEPILQDKTNSTNPLRSNLKELSDPRVRSVFTNELFPNRTTNITDVQTGTFDMAYYPTDKGPYNFESSPAELLASGKLRNPQKRWGGIMRSIDQSDFETNNIGFVQFWIQDPFIVKPTSSGGKLYLHLGNVSEDVLKDGRRFYENGLNTPNQPAVVDSTSTWGRTPVNPIQVTQAFSNDPNDRQYQDVGFDGLDDIGERTKRAKYLANLAINFGVGSQVYQQALKDPSLDNYKWYRDPSYDASGTGLLGRYKDYNNPQGNSPVAGDNSQFSPAATLYPDNEDLNRDNTLNESEEYYEYAIDLKPGMDVGLSKYIVDKRVVNPALADGTSKPENWYEFRVPIKDFTNRIGQIPDFKSIRFMRMFLTGFEDSVVLRFAQLNLVRNQWRNFTYQLDTTGSYTALPATSPTTLNISAVNIEENSTRQPIPYVIPPGIERVQLLSNNGVNLLQNEQAMSLKIANLADGDSRAVFRNFNRDLRQYTNLSMFIHAESVIGQRPVADGDLQAVIRIGQDFLNNYYEIRIPLAITPASATASADAVWPAVNNLNLALQDLITLKLRRNNSGAPITSIYRERFGNNTYSLLGNPNFGQVSSFLIAIENVKGGVTDPLNTEVWVNELRLSGIDEHGGWAALGKVDLQLGELGTVAVSANTYTSGWGTIEQRVNERARNDLLQYDVAAQLDLGRLLPARSGITIPVYASYDKTILTPQYDPYDLDVKLSQELASADPKRRDSIRTVALDQTTIQTLNFTNVRFARPRPTPHPWDIANFDFSYSYTRTFQSNPLIQSNDITRNRFGFGYSFNGRPRFREPFKRWIRGNSAWLSPLRDFNFNLSPTNIAFRADVNRQFGMFIPRIVNTYDNTVDRVDTTYDKYFTFNRLYNLRWDFTRSLNFTFTATNQSVIDEPFGQLNTKAKKDTVIRNFFKGGRNTLYQQLTDLTYNIPLNKLPISNWVTAAYTYHTTYDWIGASRLAINLGNIIENSQQNSLNATFNFNTLYRKSKWLASLDAPPPLQQQAPRPPLLPNGSSPASSTQPSASLIPVVPEREDVIRGLHGKAKREALRKWRQLRRDARRAAKSLQQSGSPFIEPAIRAAARVVTMVKQVTVNYSENYASRVPGYLDSTKIIGQNFSSMQPGLDYVFGRQPDTNWLNSKARAGVLTRDSTFNQFYRQNFQQTLDISGLVEPVRDLIVNVHVTKSFSKEYTELFKDTTGTGNNFGHLSPYATGGFSISYISFETLFRPYNPNELSGTFQEFQNNRQIISKRISSLNPYWQSLAAGAKFTADGYATGYGRYSQNVIIPAFLAAYTGRDPNKIPLLIESNEGIKSSPFKSLVPLPNWDATYNGLTRIPALQKIFSSIVIQNGYHGTLSMNSFTSALLYTDPFHLGAPAFLDSVSGNYIPFFLVPNLTVHEDFSPLVGISVTTPNQLTFGMRYNKSRTLSLSLIDYQLSEERSSEFGITFSWRKHGIGLPFALPFVKKKRLENDLNFSFEMAIRDDTQSNSRLDQATAYAVGGQRVYRINPTIDYTLNRRVRLTFYYSQIRTVPYISTSAPITNVSAGLKVNVSLAP